LTGAAQYVSKYVSSTKLQEWHDVYEAMVLAETTSADGDGKVIKPFDEAPDELSKATPENWSLGSLQCVPVNHIILRDRISILSPRHSAEIA